MQWYKHDSMHVCSMRVVGYYAIIKLLLSIQTKGELECGLTQPNLFYEESATHGFIEH